MSTPADARLLIVDDEESVRRMLARVLGRSGYATTTVASAEEAKSAFATDEFDLVLCDINLEEGSGIDLVRALRNDRPSTAVVMVTGVDDPAIAEEALSLGVFGYLVKPFGNHQMLISVRNALIRRELEAAQRAHSEGLERLVQQRTHELMLSREETIQRLALAVEARDGETAAHVDRMSRYCELVARTMGLDDSRCELIRLASPLHDVGKIGIPDRILRKPGPLTPQERVGMEKHAELGHAILAGSTSEVLRSAATIAHTHHEWFDGGGYPRGLSADGIPIEGRIAAAGDVFDALTSDRVYRAALSLDETVGTITAGRGTHFDPDVVDAFLSRIEHVEMVRASGRAP